MKIGYWRQSTLYQFENNKASERYDVDLIRAGVDPENIYSDIISGGKISRDGLDAAIARLRSGDELIFPQQSRLARDELLWEELRRWCEKNEVTMISLDRGKLDITSAAGIYTGALMAATDAYQRRMNREHSLKGHARRREKQLPLSVCFGYKVIEDKIVINHDPYKATGLTYYQVARILVDTFFEVQTCSGTARIMCDRFGFERIGTRKDFPRNHSGLSTWLKNPMIKGGLVYFPRDKSKRIELLNHHEPLVTEQEWDHIKSILSNNKFTKKTNTLRNPLSGKIFCSKCNGAMIVKQGGNARYGYYYYVLCKGAYPKSGVLKTCNQMSAYGLQIKDYIKAVTDKLIERSQKVAEWGSSGIDNDFVETEEIKSLRNKITQLKAVNDPELSDFIARKETELNELIKKEYGQQTNNQILRQELLSVASRHDFWDSVTPYELRDIFRELVDKVVCDDGKIIATLKI